MVARHGAYRSGTFAHHIKSAGPYLVLPSVVLVAILVVLGPEMWSALNTSAEVCRSFMAESVLIGALSPLAVLLISAPLFVALFAAGKELRRLKLLSSSLAISRPVSTGRSSPFPLVMLEDDRPFAFCHGLFRPRICFSTGLIEILEQEELEAVLLHEEVHARRGDPLKLFAARVTTAGLFALPISRLLRDRYVAGLETSADREVVERHGVAPLAAALLKLVGAEPSGFAVAAVSRFSPSKQWIDQLAGHNVGWSPPPIPVRLVVASAISVITSLFLAAGTIYGLNEFFLEARFCQVPLV